MKKLFFASLTLLFALAFNAQAQSTGTVNLSVTLKPIQTLVVDVNQTTVDLMYANVNDYAAGVTKNMANHLTVYSTGGFTVSVKSDAADLSKPAGYIGSSNIAANTIKILASNGTNNVLAPTYSQVSLDATNATIVDSSVGGVNQSFNIAYQGAGADAYINNYLNSHSPTVYKTTVTYTIVAK